MLCCLLATGPTAPLDRDEGMIEEAETAERARVASPTRNVILMRPGTRDVYFFYSCCCDRPSPEILRLCCADPIPSSLNVVVVDGLAGGNSHREVSLALQGSAL